MFIRASLGYISSALLISACSFVQQPQQGEAKVSSALRLVQMTTEQGTRFRYCEVCPGLSRKTPFDQKIETEAGNQSSERVDENSIEEVIHESEK